MSRKREGYIYIYREREIERAHKGYIFGSDYLYKE